LPPGDRAVFGPAVEPARHHDPPPGGGTSTRRWRAAAATPPAGPATAAWSRRTV